MADEDDKIQPLRVEQSDMKGMIKMNSLRLDMVIEEVQEFKTDSKEAVKMIRQEMHDGFEAARRAQEKQDDESKARDLKIERWLVALVGVSFTTFMGMVITVITKLL